MATLYIVATPIGNLEDISMRAVRVLSEVDFILCEDTRVTRKLLDHYKIKTPTISYHQHSDSGKTESVLKLLSEGKNLALVSDAGTPGISDPGGKLVQAALERFNEPPPDPLLRKEGGRSSDETEVRIESVPGPSAVTAALSISGIPTDKFVFMGFPPHKKGRQAFLKKIIDSEFPVVVYESKHRILKFLNELERLNKDILKRNNELKMNKGYIKRSEEEKPQKPVASVVVCRELSKMHETVYRGEIKTIKDKILESPEDQKGEFVVIIGK